MSEDPKLTEEATIYMIARLAHTLNREYCNAMGDFSQEPWGTAPEWQQKSCINGVIHALSNRDATAEDSHKSWLREKEADGWVFGPIKDPEKKTHPCMVPYEELPPSQRIKDHLFLGVVGAFISIANPYEPVERVSTE
jgi:hypothetical protein